MSKLLTVIGEITSDTLERFVRECGDNKKVVISSPGGDIGYTLAMLDAIDFHKLETHATGICQSAAAVLATAGEGKRVCTMDALFRFMPAEPELMDDPHGECPGDKVMRVSDIRNYLQSVLVSRVAQRAKMALIEAADLFDGEFITSIRAKELGLIDEVISTEVPNGSADRFPRSQEQIDGCRFHTSGVVS